VSEEAGLTGTKALVTGTGGRLGSALVAALEARGAHVKAVGRADFDLGGRDAVLEAVSRLEPELVFHTAAWTSVDGCEEDPDTAYRVNSLGTRNVCEAAQEVGARVIFVSTDHVFSGEKKSPYDEFDEPDPRSIYGRSKLWGERSVLSLGPRNVIVRTSRLFGGTGRNYVRSTLETVRAQKPGETYDAVSDQIAIPTYVPDLAEKICEVATHGGGGIYHLTSSGAPCSWAELARAALGFAGSPVKVREIKTAERPLPAPRPANGVLMSRVLVSEGIAPLPGWQSSLEAYVRSLAPSKRGTA
jgi:dTDP-4-dehydrorhamnose reductase